MDALSYAKARKLAAKKAAIDGILSNLKSSGSPLRGYQGNASAYCNLPVNLNGVYDVEFLVKPAAAELATTRRLLDFRDSGGTGFISLTSANSLSVSDGYSYIDRVSGASIADSNLHLVEVKRITLVASNLKLLTATGSTTGQNSSFLSRIRIYDHFTGSLVYEWLLDETGGTAVIENTGNGDNGTILNAYAGLYATVSTDSSSVLYSYRYIARAISKVTTTDGLMTFDDGFAEALTIVAPLLKSKGLVGNVAAVKTWVEGSDVNYLRLQDLRTLRDSYGFGIVSHTNSHANLATLYASDPAQALSEVTICQDWLNANGFDGDYLIYAQSNSANPKTKAMIKGAGVKMARVPTVNGIQPFPPEEPLSIYPIDTNGIYDNQTLARVFHMLDQAVATRSLVMTYNHNVKSDADAAAASYTNVVGLTAFTYLVNRLVKLNIRTLTMKAWYQKYYGA